MASQQNQVGHGEDGIGRQSQFGGWDGTTVEKAGRVMCRNTKAISAGIQ